MKINSTVEQIFAHAVALEQSGGLKNTIYARSNKVFILNYDHTVLLRFKLRKSEALFEHPLSFRANDYDSNQFHEEDGKIVFTSTAGEYVKVKKCSTPDLSANEVEALYRKYDKIDPERFEEITLDKTILTLLERNLSHTEFVGKKGGTIKLVQRNIYSGAIIEVQKAETGGLLAVNEVLTDDIEPIAIKTQDLMAMFTFQDVLKFWLPKRGKGDFIKLESINKAKRDMEGILACCIYDEIIEVKEATRPIPVVEKLNNSAKMQRRGK